MNAVAKRFGENLRRAREASGDSQEALAARVGLHHTEVSLLERGGREPRLGTLIKLADGLRTKPTELLAGIDWRPPAQDEQSTGAFLVEPVTAQSD